MTYEFSLFNKNNSSATKDMKNLSARMNYTVLLTLQTKFQPPPMKDERKRSFLVSWYSIVKYETLVPNMCSSAVAMILKR